MTARSLAVRALSQVSRHGLGRRVVEALETRALASMLARTKTGGPKGRAMGHLFDRYDPSRSAREIYRDVFSPERFERGYRSQVAQDLFLDRYPQDEAINLAQHSSGRLDVGIIHYASDTPYTRAQTLGARGMSYYGLDSTYASTLAILRRIFEKSGMIEPALMPVKASRS